MEEFIEAERAARIRALAQAAQALPAERRKIYLQAECGTDTDLLSATIAILNAADASTIGLAAACGDTTQTVIEGGRLGEFSLLRRLGSGAMGTVYEAHQPSMNRHVAIKVLENPLYASPEGRARFEHEAWIAGRLSHPNIVKVHSQGHEGHVHYLVMECCGGESVQTAIQQSHQADRIPTSAEIGHTLRLFIEVADALEYVHSQHVVHRDIKPSNLLFSTDKRRLLLSDFGVALDPNSDRLTKRGDFLGTVRYMSPEQLLANRVKIDGRSDIWSLGVTLYETLTSTLPFDGQTEQAYMMAVNVGDPIWARVKNPAISRDLETVVMKCMEKDPSRRYSTAAELRDELLRVLNNEPVAARRPKAWQRLWRVVLRERRLLAAAGLTSILLVAGLTFVVYMLGARHNDAVHNSALAQFARDLASGVGTHSEQAWSPPLMTFGLHHVRLIQVSAPPGTSGIQFSWPTPESGPMMLPTRQTYCLPQGWPAQPVLAGLELSGLMDLQAEPPLASRASLWVDGHSSPILSFPFVFGGGQHSFQVANTANNGKYVECFRGVFADVTPNGTLLLEGRKLSQELPRTTTLAGKISFEPSPELAAEFSFKNYRMETLLLPVSVDIITVVANPVPAMACHLN